MCKFLSAIVMRDGTVICDPEHTDSHEDLILANRINDGVVDHMREHFCRIEFVPPTDGDIADLSLWTLALDEQAEPSWWQEKRDGVRAYLADLVTSHIITDKRPILLGGWWVVCGSAEICKVITAAIKAVRGSASITNVRGSASITDVWGSASITDVGDSASITDDHRISAVGSVAASKDTKRKARKAKATK